LCADSKNLERGSRHGGLSVVDRRTKEIQKGQNMDENGIYSPYRWLILLVGCLSFMSYSVDMIVYAPIFGEVAKDLNIDMGAAISLSVAFAMASGLAMILGGVLVDKCGITIALVLGLLCASLTAVLLPWIGHSYTIVFVSRLVQGVVAITMATVGPILALWFPREEHGLASGLLMCSLSVGAALGVVASPAVFEFVGSWQKTVAVLSIPGWVTILLVLLVTRRPPSPKVVEAITDAMKSASSDVNYRKIFASPVTWVGTLIALANAWGLYGLYNIIPPYLATQAPMGLGLGPAMAGKLSLALTLVGIPAFIVGGIFVDKVVKGKHRPAIFIGFVMTGVFTYLLLFPFVYQNLLFLAACLIIAGLGMGFMAPSLTAFIAINYPPKFVGSVVGWWFGFGTLVGGALATYIAGLSTGRLGTFYWALTPVSIICCVGIILGVFLKPKT
jgi:MFS family permease